MIEPIYQYVKGEGWVLKPTVAFNPQDYGGNWINIPGVDTYFYYPQICKNWTNFKRLNYQDFKVGDVVPYGGGFIRVVSRFEGEQIWYHQIQNNGTHRLDVDTLRQTTYDCVARQE